MVFITLVSLLVATKSIRLATDLTHVTGEGALLIGRGDRVLVIRGGGRILVIGRGGHVPVRRSLCTEGGDRIPAKKDYGLGRALVKRECLVSWQKNPCRVEVPVLLESEYCRKFKGLLRGLCFV